MVLIEDNSTVLEIGDLMPHFTLPSTDGLDINASNIDADIVVIIFNCNHCPFAKAYEQRIKDLDVEFSERGVQFIMISSNDAESYPEDSFEAMKEMDYEFPYCYDESQEVAKAYGALCTPHCFVFNKKRELAYKGQVDDNWKEPESVTSTTLKDAIVDLLEGREVAVPAAHAIGCSIKWKD